MGFNSGFKGLNRTIREQRVASLPTEHITFVTEFLYELQHVYAKIASIGLLPVGEHRRENVINLEAFQSVHFFHK